jgi:hypothetical protein
MIALARPARRPWTAAEDDTLRRSYGRVRFDALAEGLDRTFTAISHRAYMLGLGTPRRGLACSPKRIARLRELHAEGRSDGEIARALRVDQAAVCRLRHRLGLPVNPRAFDDRYRARAAATNRERCYLARAGFAARRGWPVDLPSLSVRILDAMHNDGPHTRRGLMAPLGLRRHTYDFRLRDSSGDALRLLLRRGLVVASGQARDPVTGRLSTLYALAPGVRPGKQLALSGVALA